MNCPKGELILVISVINFMLFTSIETVSVVLSSQHDLFIMFIYFLFIYLYAICDSLTEFVRSSEECLSLSFS